MKVIFSHGKESGPWGSKIKALADIAQSKGCLVDSIDYTQTLNPDCRVKQLTAYLNSENSDIILVGSSMGGYVSLLAAEQYPVKGLFLLAPALYIPDYEHQNYITAQNNIEIVHGWRDDIIPYQHSIDYAKQANASLHLIDGDHRLNDAIEQVKTLFDDFLSKTLNR